MTDEPNKNGAARGESSRNSVGENLDIARLLSVLSAGKWWIVGFVIVTVLLAVSYLRVTPYTYSADALLQIQSSQSSPFGGGGGPAVAEATNMAALFGGVQSAAQSEIPIIKSREVLGKTVRDLNLAIDAHPKSWPIIGNAFADKKAHVTITRFQVPSDLENKPFELRFDTSNRFTLVGPHGVTVTQGRIGQAASGKTKSGGKVSIYVQSVRASDWPQTFTVSRHAWLSAVTALQDGLTVKETTTGSDVLNLSLEGQSRSQITDIVNSIAQNYVQQNVEARSQQAAQSLKFLKTQLPKLKSKVNSAESKLAQYQEKHQPVDLSAQAQALLGQVSSLEDKRSQLKLKIAQLSQQYTSQYPELQAARDQLAQLKQQSNELDKHINKLPNSQKEMLGLERDVKVNTQLYTALLNRAQELRVAKAGTVGNVRIVDKAVRPVAPVAPRSKLVLVAAVLLGLILGVAFVLLRVALRRAVSDPHLIEQQTGLPVYAVIPFSSWLARAKRRAARAGGPYPVLALDNEGDAVAEALRSLRTSLYFAQMESDSKVLIMTGPSPGVGKSFLSVNLGYLLTEVDQRIIVVDADMRRGTLHEYLGVAERNLGLSEVLAGEVSAEEVIQRVPNTRLDAITSGAVPTNPSELLMRAGFKTLISELQSNYDLIIVDAPPILAATDAAVVAAAVTKPTTFMVLGSGRHPMDEIHQAVERFTRQRGELTGFILNAYQASKARTSHGAIQYQYNYASKS